MNRKKKIFFFCKFLRLSVLIIASKSYRLKGFLQNQGLISNTASGTCEKDPDSEPKPTNLFLCAPTLAINFLTTSTERSYSTK